MRRMEEIGRWSSTKSSFQGETVKYVLFDSMLRSHIYRARQYLYPLELECNAKPVKRSNLNAEAVEFTPKYQVAVVAVAIIKEIMENGETDI